MIPRGPRKNVAFIVCKGLQLASRAVAKEGVIIKDSWIGKMAYLRWTGLLTCRQVTQILFNLLLSVVHMY